MKLAIIFVHSEDAERSAKDLVQKNIRFTIIDSISGFLAEETRTFLIGIPAERLEECLQTFRDNCRERQIGAPTSLLAGLEIKPDDLGIKHKPVTVRQGGAVGFVLDVDTEFRT